MEHDVPNTYVGDDIIALSYIYIYIYIGSCIFLHSTTDEHLIT